MPAHEQKISVTLLIIIGKYIVNITYIKFEEKQITHFKLQIIYGLEVKTKVMKKKPSQL